ncbi:MAG: hypothetical protein QOD92_453 [Acidimicrobiaceae bacterium]
MCTVHRPAPRAGVRLSERMQPDSSARHDARPTHTWPVQILVGTAAGLGRLDDDGTVDWLLKGDVTAIDRGWAIVDHDGMIAIDDPRTAIATPLPALCLASAPWGVMIGTAEAHLLELGRGTSSVSPVASFDRIPTRDEWYTPSGGPPDTRSITVTPDGTPLVNVHVGGVWRGDDGSWREVIDVDNDTHQILATTDDVVVAAAAVGFGQSEDGGRTFSWTTDGLHDTYCRAVAVADDIVLVTASTGPFTRHGAVYLRPIDSREPFTRCDNGLPEWFEGNIDTFQLVARGSTVVLGTDKGHVFVSQDAGISWELAAAGIGAVRCVAIT